MHDRQLNLYYSSLIDAHEAHIRYKLYNCYVYLLLQRGLKLVYQQAMIARPPVVMGGPAGTLCSCGVSKDVYRNAALPIMQCPSCLSYWCCIGTCQQEFVYVVDVLRHQFIGHGQSASITDRNCSSCQTPKPRRTDFSRSFVTCPQCSKHMCAIDDCRSSLPTIVGTISHAGQAHGDPYTCSCGVQKFRNTRKAQCRNCGAFHCLFGHCTKQVLSSRGLAAHQNACPLN